MPNLKPGLWCLSLLLGAACNAHPEPAGQAVRTPPSAKPARAAAYPYLRGAWVGKTKHGFTLLEIQDTAHVRYYHYRQPSPGEHQEYYYAASKATMGYHNPTSIWVLTDDVRLDYIIDGEKLREYDKMGEQGVLNRVYTALQKAYREFNQSQLGGVITDVQDPLAVVGASRSRDTTELLVLNNRDWQYSFTTIGNAAGNRFSELAAVGDSVIKPKFADTLVLRKQQTGQRLKFAFREF